MFEGKSEKELLSAMKMAKKKAVEELATKGDFTETQAEMILDVITSNMSFTVDRFIQAIELHEKKFHGGMGSALPKFGDN